MAVASFLLRLIKLATGEKPNAWGVDWNTNLELIGDAVAGFKQISVNGNVTLSSENFAADEARLATLRFVGTGLQGNNLALVTAPTASKQYRIHNICDNDITLGTGAGSIAICRKGQITDLYIDGTDTFALDPTLDTIRTPAAPVAGFDGVLPTDFATYRQTGPFNVQTAKDWATKTDGEVIPGEGYSAKWWAQNAASFSNSGKASTAEAKAGTDTNKWMTPATTQDALYKALQVNGRVTKNATTTLTSADRGRFIQLVGSPTINLPSAASDPTFFFWVAKNDGSGTARRRSTASPRSTSIRKRSSSTRTGPLGTRKGGSAGGYRSGAMLSRACPPPRSRSRRGSATANLRRFRRILTTSPSQTRVRLRSI